jgi:1-deoxy-D-xylulose-5-phosphate reductoisomerase
LTNSCNNKDIQEIILTASGGPFLKSSIKSLKQKKSSSAIKHPRWKMGKKISIDSANLMNKVFEIFEAYSFFKFDYDKFKILIHPQSYVHAIVRYTNGLIKMILHDTDMKIPIANTLYEKDTNIKNVRDINPINFSNLHFEAADPRRFPSLTLLKVVKKNNYMAPTILNASNEELVKLFLDGKIYFTDIVKILKKITKLRDFKRFSKKRPKTINDIMCIDQWARLKTQSLSVE